MTINYDYVLSKLLMLQDAERVYYEICTAGLPQPTECPHKPGIIEDVEAHNAWLEANRKVERQRQEIRKNYEDAVRVILESSNVLRSQIPPNTWVRIGSQYIGYKTVDWPMYIPAIQCFQTGEDGIFDTPPLLQPKELRL